MFQVKKILDKYRCQELTEGDILVEINSINVRNMSHNKVVQVLKDCQTNQAASITIQRCIQNSPDKFRLKNKKVDIKNVYRSKTPIEDRPHDINRSKTPIVDNQIQLSKIANNVLENGSSDTFIMNNSLSHASYSHRAENSWVQLNPPSTKICCSAPNCNELIDPAIEHYINQTTEQYMNSQPDHCCNNLSKALQNMSFCHYEMNNSKNEVR